MVTEPSQATRIAAPAFTRAIRRPLTPPQLAALTGMTSSSAQRTVHTLEARGYVDRYQQAQGYACSEAEFFLVDMGGLVAPIVSVLPMPGKDWRGGRTPECQRLSQPFPAIYAEGVGALLRTSPAAPVFTSALSEGI
ncbi:hypothetical protein E0W60_17265 [Cupriavidus oxalaticus]|uniref:HTH marR-type domain-containing protein n=1 Tax=Cupriavidus oxalaticus TaxID=96344 RepID=A0A4P7LFN3_9BURK|nr:hypothetical protein E0W60_17265 [Cupriavidus oxalaticus]